MQNKKTGVLLLYTGSPDAATPESVRRYLKRFLMDPHVLTMPGWIRWFLVHGIIVPLRAGSSAAKYKSIWMAEGSPLTVYTKRLQCALQEALPEYSIAAASAYGADSISEALGELLDVPVDRLIVFPLFPHFAGATRGSLIAMLDATIQQSSGRTPERIIIPAFYRDSAYIESLCGIAAPALAAFKPDHVVFSYHGLPRRQGQAASPEDDGYSYEEQCCQTTDKLAAALGVDKRSCTQAYQSRFGRGWLEPNLEPVLEELAASGHRRVALLAPSFVSDCLETLEELDLRAREVFLGAGGAEFLRIPALNADPVWTLAVAEMIQRVD